MTVATPLADARADIAELRRQVRALPKGRMVAFSEHTAIAVNEALATCSRLLGTDLLNNDARRDIGTAYAYLCDVKSTLRDLRATAALTPPSATELAYCDSDPRQDRQMWYASTPPSQDVALAAMWGAGSAARAAGITPPHIQWVKPRGAEWEHPVMRMPLTINGFVRGAINGVIYVADDLDEVAALHTSAHEVGHLGHHHHGQITTETEADAAARAACELWENPCARCELVNPLTGGLVAAQRQYRRENPWAFE